MKPNSINPHNKPIDYREHEYDFMDCANVACTTDCTGLIQQPPENEDEIEAYQDLSDMQTPKK